MIISQRVNLLLQATLDCVKSFVQMNEKISVLNLKRVYECAEIEVRWSVRILPQEFNNRTRTLNSENYAAILCKFGAKPVKEGGKVSKPNTGLNVGGRTRP